MTQPTKTPKQIVQQWLDVPHLKLHAGEMTAQEVRTVKAVLNAIVRELDQAAPEVWCLVCDYGSDGGYSEPAFWPHKPNQHEIKEYLGSDYVASRQLKKLLHEGFCDTQYGSGVSLYQVKYETAFKNYPPTTLTSSVKLW